MEEMSPSGMAFVRMSAHRERCYVEFSGEVEGWRDGVGVHA